MNDVKDAVRVILRGVSRNRAIIIDSWLGRLMWRIYRFLPALTHLNNRFAVKNSRAKFRNRS
jgi:hypothetical protein